MLVPRVFLIDDDGLGDSGYIIHHPLGSGIELSHDVETCAGHAGLPEWVQDMDLAAMEGPDGRCPVGKLAFRTEHHHGAGIKIEVRLPTPVIVNMCAGPHTYPGRNAPESR
jgi:hypothetical protein